jgi:hypothetical protein
MHSGPQLLQQWPTFMTSEAAITFSSFWYLDLVRINLYINEIHSLISNENKQKPRYLIGQTAITWPLHKVSENRGNDY